MLPNIKSYKYGIDDKHISCDDNKKRRSPDQSSDKSGEHQFYVKPQDKYLYDGYNHPVNVKIMNRLDTYGINTPKCNNESTNHENHERLHPTIQKQQIFERKESSKHIVRLITANKKINQNSEKRLEKPSTPMKIKSSIPRQSLLKPKNSKSEKVLIDKEMGMKQS